MLVKIDRTGSIDRVADSSINDRLVKLRPLIDQMCFEFIDVSSFDENADINLSDHFVEYLRIEYLIP